MSQDIFADIDPDNTDGGQLAVLLGQFRDAVISGFSGPTRPPELEPGGYWIDTSLEDPPDNKWLIKLWTGVIDIVLFDITTNSGVVTIPGTSNSFNILKSSNDALGPALTFEKSRIAGTGAVQAGDSIGTFTFSGRDSGGITRLGARIDVIAAEDFIGTQFGSGFSIKTVDLATNVLSEKIVVGATVEIKAPILLHGIQYSQENIATTATINALNVTEPVVRFTGSTATQINGIDHLSKSKLVFIHNVSSADITIMNDNASATDVQDKILLDVASVKVKPLQTLGFFWDSAAQRWKALSGAGSGSGAGGLIVADSTARLAIPSGDRYDGLKVYQLDIMWNYQLRGGITNSDWAEEGNPTFIYTANATTRDAIATNIRKHGLSVFQQDTQQVWRLGAGLTNADWYKVGFAGVEKTVVKTANATIAADERYVYVNATSGNITLTLPAAVSGNVGEQHTFFRTDNSANTVTIAAAGSDTINGAATDTLPYQFNYAIIQAYAATSWGKI